MNQRRTRSAAFAAAAIVVAAALGRGALGAEAQQPADATGPAPDPREMQRQIETLQEEVRQLRAERAAAAPTTTPAPAPAGPTTKEIEATVKSVLKDADKQTHDKKWYDKLGIRGYTQVRYQMYQSYDDPGFNVPADRSVGVDQTFVIRRGRLILSGDVTDHLYLYGQIDVAGSVSSDLDFAVQARDIYADINLDEKKEFRVRVGQSKVPFGWVNLQSSQNRAAFERPDALNSAVEGERDIGASFMWAPKEARDRFKELVSKGLKGSGDYGVLSIGAYSGQGLNRSDRNNETHFVARASYPFKLPSGQFVEAGIQAYTGRFVVSTGAVDGVTPEADSAGIRDDRVGATFVWYPQPFGIEAEWNVGQGPQLSSDLTEIESEYLHGGYVQLNYKIEKPSFGLLFPFLRWNYYDGGRKFARNAPASLVNEIDAGIEWSPWPELELTAQYTRTIDRTNTRTAPYEDGGGDRFGMQLQFNY
jgi:hypothetical protein